MGDIKKYLPWIIGAAVVLFILSRLSSRSTSLVPQTQITQTPQPDPYSADRASAFGGLLQLAGLQTQADADTERARITGQITSRAQDIQYALGLKSLDVDLAKTDILSSAAERAADLNFMSRENDRQIQQGAIDRYYSSRTEQSILGSINTALAGIFGQRGGGGVFTPTTFPRSNFNVGGGFSF